MSDDIFKYVMNVTGLGSIERQARQLLSGGSATEVPEETDDQTGIVPYQPEMVDLSTLFPGETSRLAEGDVNIGIDHTGVPVNIKLSDFGEHTLLMGRTGVGKTNAIMRLIYQLAQKGVRFIAFDFAQDYRRLIPYIPNLLVFRVVDGHLKYNPLEVAPGDDARQALQLKTVAFSSAFGLWTASESLLFEKMTELYASYGVFNDGQAYPSLSDLRDYLKVHEPKVMSQERNYWERIINRLSAICVAIEPTIECHRGYPMDQLLQFNVVFELDGLLSEVQNYLVFSLWNDLIQTINHTATSSPICPQLSRVFVMDEANRIFARRSGNDGMDLHNIVTNTFNTIRHHKIGMITATQMPTQLDQSVRANTATKILMNLGDGKEMYDARQMMGLTEQQQRFAESTLAKGLAVAKLSDRYMLPFLVQIPETKFDQEVTSQDVLNRLQKFGHYLAYTPRSLDLVKKAIQAKRTDIGIDSRQKMEDQLLWLLINIAEQPTLTKMARYIFLAGLGLSQNKAYDLVKDAERQGYVTSVAIQTGKKGSPPELMDLTSSGRQYLISHERSIPARSRGGVKHYYWQEMVKYYYESQGYNVELEAHFPDADAYVDVLAIKDEKRTAIQIAVSPDYEPINIDKCVRLGIEQIIVACDSEEVMRKVAKYVLAGNVKVLLAREFLA